ARLVLFVYLNQVPDLRALVREAGLPDESVTLLSLARDEVLKCLCAADVGLLVLESAPRFDAYVAPIKLAEYLSAGLPVLVNERAARIPDLLRRHGAGWVLPQDAGPDELHRTAARVLADLARDREGLRQRALAACEATLLWSNYVPAIRRAYGLAGSLSLSSNGGNYRDRNLGAGSRRAAGGADDRRAGAPRPRRPGHGRRRRRLPGPPPTDGHRPQSQRPPADAQRGRDRLDHLQRRG